MIDSKKNIIGQIFLAVLSFVGMVVMGYLIYVHYSPVEGSFCNLGEGLSCDIVNKSIYSKFFGIPLSILGFLYFLGIFVASIGWYDKSSVKIIAFLSIIFLGPSLYLTGIEIFVLENICVLCELSKALILVILFISLWVVGLRKFTVKAFVSAIILAALLAGVVYFFQSRVVPDGKYDTFTQCVYDSNLRMYGSKGCSFCAKQRALFGGSFESVEGLEIECDPRYEGHQVELCVSRDITHTPTWILDDKEGNEVFRFEPGVQSLEELSEVSKCPLIEDL